jgi:glycerate 2-kinase
MVEFVNRQTEQTAARQDALTIWRAGVAAVDSMQLVHRAVQADDQTLIIAGETFSLGQLARIVVVGAGKAGAGMAAGVETALGKELVDAKVSGWINVPADCVRPLRRIHLHAARPAGLNEPTADGVFGSIKILELVQSLTDKDLCLVLISGGGSALLPAPVPEISLADKQAVTRCLMRSGATIHELNTVRKRLSCIKGGGLLRAAKAGKMVALIISDVPGDPLDIIASGPTVCDHGGAADALEVLDRFVGRDDVDQKIPATVWRFLEEQVITAGECPNSPVIPCQNHIIGNNRTAVDAAASAAVAIGYDVRLLGVDRQGIARNVGFELAELALSARLEAANRSICYIAGGEPVVKLAETDLPRRGGRNQEVVLAAACRLMGEDMRRIVILSGGTDGEDGPTDAAGAVFDETVQQLARTRQMCPDEFLAINNSYNFFSPLGGLLVTGPTNTNVMDLQIALVTGTAP